MLNLERNFTVALNQKQEELKFLQKTIATEQTLISKYGT